MKQIIYFIALFSWLWIIYLSFVFIEDIQDWYKGQESIEQPIGYCQSFRNKEMAGSYLMVWGDGECEWVKE